MVNNNGAYAVTVKTQPALSVCHVTNGSGTVASADVTSVTVTCGLKVMVVRVGDGQAAPTSASNATSLEERDPVDGSVLRTIALPIAAAGTQQPLTLGNSNTEGGLSRSADGKFVTLAGYAAAPGVAAISATTASATNRVAGRIDASGAIDTTTRLNSAFSTGNVRAATTVDGTAFWIAGSNAGIHYATLGSTGASTQIASVPSNMRHTHVFGGQLYVTSASGTTQGVLSVGTGTPTSPATATPLPGMPAATSPYSFALIGSDTLYMSQDAAPTASNIVNVQKWKLVSGTWTQTATFAPALTGASVGTRGLAAFTTAGGVRVFATTNETAANRLVTFLDTGTDTPAVTVVSTAPQNTLYRGVAVSPSP
jgi:hypothetical protein